MSMIQYRRLVLVRAAGVACITFDEEGTEMLETEPWVFCNANMNS